ncbi:MAG: ADOP family duplicated permease [Limisphaerales bacterium]
MSWLRKTEVRLRALFQKRRLDAEMDEEMRAHVEMQTQENIEAGMKPEDARYAALRQFGWAESIKETCREQRGTMWVENLVRDLRFGARMLRKNPGFTAISVLTLALGIGATSAVFSLVQGVLLTPPPYPKPEQVVLIEPARKDGQPYARDCATSQWLEWRNTTNCFQCIAAYRWGFQFLLREDGSESVQGLCVTPEYFEVIGVRPLLGRAFSQADMAAQTGTETTIILGYDLWRRRFSGDPRILGQAIHLSRHPPLTVIGVMPPGARLLPSCASVSFPNCDVNAKIDFWLLLGPPDLKRPEASYCNAIVGRLRDRVTLAQARAELTTIADRQAKADERFQGITARADPLMAAWNREGRRMLLPLMGAVILAFLIACANIGGLLLARGIQRQQEYAVRCALGAQRIQLFRQVLTESLLVSLSGGSAGIGLAMATVRALKIIGGHAIPRLDAVAIGWPVLACCLGSVVVAAIIAGLAPAIHAVRLNAAEGLKGARTSGLGLTERRFLGGVATVQIALTLALLMGAGLLIRTMINLANINPGYSTQNVLTMDVTTPDQDYADRGAFHSEALARIAAIPGIRHVAFGWGVPLTGNSAMSQVRVEGRSATDAGTGRDFINEVAVATRFVTADFFNVLNLRIVNGRGFRLSDGWCGPGANTNAPFVAIVNQAMARKYFDDQDPIGRRIKLNPGFATPAEIIGVVADSRNGSLVQPPEPEVYFYYFQVGTITKRLVIQTAADPLRFVGTVQHELRVMDPKVAIEHVATMAQIRAESVASQALAMRLLVAFSLVASVLALIGIYGVLSLSVDSRKREIAIRLAVGAPRRTVLGLVLSGGVKLIAVGLFIGIGAAIALAQVLRAFLFGVEPTDLITFVAVAILFAAEALLVCLLPALRATRVDPMTALRCE